MKFRINEKRIKSAKSFNSIFDAFLDEFNIKNEISVEKLKDDWNTIVGPLLGSHSFPVNIDRDIIYISADHSVFSNDLIMMKGDILKKINSIYSSSISSVRIVSSSRNRKS